MKMCTICGVVESEGKSGKCIECRRAYNREYYQRNKAGVWKSREKYRGGVRQRLRDIKDSTPCADCNIQYPYYVMDFDHRENKSFNISVGANLYGLEKILAEVAKCDVVCANCHRERTQKQNSFNLRP